MFDTEPFMKWTQSSISLTNYQMGQLDCGAKTNVCQAKTYQNHGEQRSLTRAYYYHITFVARLSSRKAFINRRLGCGGAVVRALASHQCGPESYPDIDAICGLSLLLVLSLVMRGFFPGTPVFPSPQEPTFPNYNSTRNQVYEEPLCDSVFAAIEYNLLNNYFNKCSFPYNVLLSVVIIFICYTCSRILGIFLVWFRSSSYCSLSCSIFG